jgi:hypothetical protein
MFQVFHMFQRYVARVSFGYCKSRSRYCICCNVYTCMLQAPILDVSSVFICMLQVFYLDVEYVFTHMLHVCHLDVAYVCNGFQVFLGVLQVFQMYVTSVSAVSDICCKCFI